MTTNKRLLKLIERLSDEQASRLIPVVEQTLGLGSQQPPKREAIYSDDDDDETPSNPFAEYDDDDLTRLYNRELKKRPHEIDQSYFRGLTNEMSNRQFKREQASWIQQQAQQAQAPQRFKQQIAQELAVARAGLQAQQQLLHYQRNPADYSKAVDLVVRLEREYQSAPEQPQAAPPEPYQDDDY